MTRKIVLIITLCALLYPAPTSFAGEQPRRGMYVTVLQEPWVLASRDDIAKLVRFAKDAGMSDLFIQIYRANRSWFPSRVADQAPYETCRAAVGEDPLQLLITDAHAAGIRVHAWLNLLSLSANTEAPLLKQYGPEILTCNTKTKCSITDYMIDNQYFLEPGDERVRAALANVTEEIVRAYPDLDGIQFDYIRYPDRDPYYGYTTMNVSRFKAATGRDAIDDRSVVWRDWKRGQVTGLLEQLVARARAIRPDITLSTTGCAPYCRAYKEAFQDWPSWVQTRLVDFVTVMTYATKPETFERYVTEARTVVPEFSRVNIAIGAYDMAAAPDTFKREYAFASASGCGSCVIFHYESLLANPELARTLLSNRKGS